MTPFSQWLGLLTGILAAVLSWQINVVAVHRGLARGWIAAFLVGCGATLGDALLIFAAFSGARPLLSRHEFWLPLKWIGIATLFILVLKILFHRHTEVKEEPARGNQTKNFLIGLVIVIGNPAVLLLWAGITTFILTHFPALQPPFMHLIFVAEFFAGSILWFFLLSLVLLPRIRKWGEGRLEVISKFSAGALLLALLYAIFGKF